MFKVKVNEIVVGAYYELPCGKIAYTFGSNTEKVSYRFEQGPSLSISHQEVLDTWTRRDDLRDFPNAIDPRLPYVFDLFWDIKYTSELKEVLRSKDHPDYRQIYEKALECGLI